MDYRLSAIHRVSLLCVCEQDLREECIKLKMLVFDLERQNRALCELFQQKLPNHPTAHYQVTNSVSSLFRQKNIKNIIISAAGCTKLSRQAVSALMALFLLVCILQIK